MDFLSFKPVQTTLGQSLVTNSNFLSRSYYMVFLTFCNSGSLRIFKILKNSRLINVFMNKHIMGEIIILFSKCSTL